MRTQLVLALFALAAAALAPATARADSTVVVLGITSIEGDDELARNLTGAIRNAASRVDDWQVSDSEVTLAQMALAHGCSDEPDTGCLSQIASTVGSQFIVYGILRRASSGHGVTIALSLYDAQSGHIERSVSEQIPSSRTDIDDLRDPARRLIQGLSGPQTGALRLTSNVPNATVLIDDEEAGTTGSDGSFASSTIRVGEHTVRVTATGRTPWTGTVTIATGQEMTLDATLTDGGGGGGGGGGGPGVSTWIGIGLLGVAAAALVVSFYSMARIDQINSEADYQHYRGIGDVMYRWPEGMAPSDICAAASAGTINQSTGSMGIDPSRIASLCSEGSTFEVLQYVFLITGIAAAGGGIALIATDSSGSSSEAAPSAMILPTFTRDGVGLRVFGSF